MEQEDGSSTWPMGREFSLADPAQEDARERRGAAAAMTRPAGIKELK